MGHIRHEAIIVTGYRADPEYPGAPDITHAQDKATMLGLEVTDIIQSVMNGYTTFVVVPDGGKEGWSTSDEYGLRRASFLEWLKTNNRNFLFDWVHIQYGDDDGVTEVKAHSDEDINPL